MAQFDSEWEQLLKSSQPKNFSNATVFDILSRLPVKSILRFKTACKKWYALSGDSQFIEAHLNRSVEGSDWHYLVGGCSYEEIKDFGTSVFSLMSEENFQHLCELHFKPEPFYLYNIVASADGIVCIVIINRFLSDDILLWNPATRELKILPKFNPDQTCFGFGFDAKTNDYVVVAILHGKDSFEVNVYSPRTDSWRVVEVDSSYKLQRKRQSTVYVNGRMHWLGSVGSHELIVSYDVAEENFIEMDMPGFEYPNRFARALCESPASLGKSVILCDFVIKGTCQTWFMKEYGDSKSWDKLYCFPTHPIYGRLQPRIFLDNGEIMMQSEENMLLCDPKNQVYEVLNVYLDAFVVKYKDSLVSIKGGGGCISNLNHCA